MNDLQNGLDDALAVSETNKMKLLLSFFRDETGATAIEYGLIASLIAVVIVAAAGALGTKLSGTFNNIKGKLS